MASSSSRKSNSSASKQKPTFRRSTGATSQHRSSSAKATPSKPAAAPSSAAPKRARTYTAPTKKSASLRVSSAHTGKSSSAAPVARKAASGTRKATPVARKATPRAAAAATSIARKGSAARGASTRVKATSTTVRPSTSLAPAAKPARPQAAKAPRKKKLTLPASSSGLGRARAATGAEGPSLSDRFRAVLPARRSSASPAPATPARRDGSQRPRAGLGSIGIARLAIVIVLFVAVMGGLGAAIVYNSGLFAATNVIVNGSAHIPQQTAQQLIDVPEGATLLNVNEKELSERLVENPWVERVNVEREFPHTLVITPVECEVSAIAYIVADDVAWAISDDDVWIAPLSVAVEQTDTADDASGDDAADADEATDGDDASGADEGADGEGDSGADAADADGADAGADAAATASGVEAALKVAQDNDAVLLTDVGADVSPSSGKAVDSDVILAGMKYVHGFSPEFLAQVKDISVPSIEAISLNLDSGVEVSLGAPEDIQQKEQVIRSLLEQQEGVTYINVRVPDAYSFRSADV